MTLTFSVSVSFDSLNICELNNYVYYGTFLGLSDLFSSKSFHLCYSTILLPLIANSLAVEDAVSSFVDIETALILNSRVSQ